MLLKTHATSQHASNGTCTCVFSTVIEQRCIFHKLRNVADKCREERKGEVKKETRKQLMEQASAMYQAESAEEAKQRLAAFANTWRARTRHPL